MRKTADIVSAAAAGDHIVVVFSAMSGVTDAIVGILGAAKDGRSPDAEIDLLCRAHRRVIGTRGLAGILRAW